MLDLQQIKTHLRVDGDEEDTYIQALADAALSAFTALTNRVLIDPAETLPEPPGNALRLNDTIRQGALLLIGHWYARRETVVTGTVMALPFGTNALWQPYRWANV